MKIVTFLKEYNHYILTVIALAIIFCAMIYMYAIASPYNFEKDNLVVLSKGSTLQDISKQLARERVIASPRVFSRIVVLLGDESSVKAGSYYFSEPQNAFAVAERLLKGEQGLNPIRVTIPEGYTREQITHLFQEDFERFNTSEFIALTQDKEGYLFPDTYFFFPDATATDVIIQMEQNFRDKTVRLSKVFENSDQSFQDIITMASIVEAEAYDFEDMRKIAGVLWKRLEIGMRLQVDVTFRYINGKGTFDLTQDDLRIDSPYNTYVYEGLPPTPISNPGLDAIIATLDYEETDFLFFLADKTGNVHFSKNFEEHKKQKALYLQ